jgi:hypothetical protein
LFAFNLSAYLDDLNGIDGPNELGDLNERDQRDTGRRLPGRPKPFGVGGTSIPEG